MGPSLIKIAGIVLPIVGAGLSLVNNWFEDKKLDDKVAKKVAEAFKKQK